MTIEKDQSEKKERMPAPIQFENRKRVYDLYLLTVWWSIGIGIAVLTKWIPEFSELANITLGGAGGATAMYIKGGKG